jgi:hypothetical protein
MDYSASTHCSAKLFTEPLSSSGHIRHNIHGASFITIHNTLNIKKITSFTEHEDSTG